MRRLCQTLVSYIYKLIVAWQPEGPSVIKLSSFTSGLISCPTEIKRDEALLLALPGRSGGHSLESICSHHLLPSFPWVTLVTEPVNPHQTESFALSIQLAGSGLKEISSFTEALL